MKVGDFAVALAMSFVAVVGTAFAGHFSDLDQQVNPLAFVLAAGAGLGLLLRRRWPLVALGVVTVLVTTYLWLHYPYGPVMFTFSVATYSAARYLPLNRAAVAVGIALVVESTHLFANRLTTLPGAYGLIPAAAFTILPFAVGYIVRVNRESVERARAEAIRDRLSDERLRVAQEVHDVVGHGLAAIKMQADIALHLMAKKPGQAEIALQAISRTSTEALDELRATLSIVRGRAPAPGLSLLPDLTDRMSHAGVEVRVNVVGSERKLPAAVDLVGYRIVQESLTNVLKHSTVKRATVRVGYTDDAVQIAVSNPATVVAAGDGGMGISGMRDRVTSLGGEFSAGPTEDGRFEVRAAIPTGGTT